MAKKGLKGTWPQALVSFFGPILAILIIRWAVLEPYVIPSGSMIPNLLIHDHVAVEKFAFGIHVPFSDAWMIHWNDPRAGETVVFRYPENPEVFFIKRLIGRPGDIVHVEAGKIAVNGQSWTLEKVAETKGLPDSDEFDYFVENGGDHPHVVRFSRYGSRMPEAKDYVVPEGQYFFMGDNRDESSDGRTWGMVPEKNLVGKAWLIWLSCDEMLESAKFVCDPSKMRWSRIFRKVDGSP